MKFNPKTAKISELRNEILFLEDMMYQSKSMDIRNDILKIIREYRREYERKLKEDPAK